MSATVKAAPATKKDKLNSLYKECGLVKEDVHVHQHYTILTRSGIEKVQAHYGIQVSYKALVLQEKYVVIKAIGTMVEENTTAKIETYGSATATNCKNSYFAETAEKRALSRAVLKLTGLYQHGFFGEEESEDFGKAVQQAQQATASAPAVVNQPAAQQPISEIAYASEEQKAEITRLLNNPVIKPGEKTKMLLGIHQLTEERADGAITKLNATIEEREGAQKAA
ncbi:hypothetical protein [Hymenobacter glacieicola]|uniref:Single-stranded DNA-binding protein n=1 Tax=Hymenobacter glacieicola TaxID=1562124 RepID=A0ABQ1X6E2_9BACT|nr:hypothetical protein [Hymenobacter glacieicola]GGG60911.1 hypothetical protein GCM10011378_41140 [Hymenobacter glacieicola]